MKNSGLPKTVEIEQRFEGALIARRTIKVELAMVGDYWGYSGPGAMISVRSFDGAESLLRFSGRCLFTSLEALESYLGVGIISEISEIEAFFSTNAVAA